MQAFLEEKREEIAELCRTHHVLRLAVFGSAAREDFAPETSDVDILVKFAPLAEGRYSENFYDLEEQFSRLLGRDVDLIADGLIRNPFIQRAIERDQVQLYAA